MCIVSMESCIPHGHLNNAPLLFCFTVDVQPIETYSKIVSNGYEKSILYAYSQALIRFDCSYNTQYLLQTPTTCQPENILKYCSPVAVDIVSPFRFIWCVCDMLSCASALNGVGSRIRQKANGLLFAVLLLFAPEGKHYHHR